MLRTEADVRRLVLEAAEDDVRDGGRWLEIQVDPSGYAARFNGITAFTDLVLDAVRDAEQRTGLGMAVVIAANRTRHQLDARTLARLAAQYVGRGVVGFGLSNDERRGVTSEFAPAFAIAERAGLMLVPHGGELLGPDSIRTCLDVLHANRLGHGVRAAEDPALLDRIVQAGVALEVCPVSNVALGVYSDLTSVPLPTLLEAGATIALGADDPLLFGSRLAAQYATMRAAHDLSDETLAELARMSVRASRAPDDTKSRSARRHRRVAGGRTWDHGRHERNRPRGADAPRPARLPRRAGRPTSSRRRRRTRRRRYGQAPYGQAPYGQQPYGGAYSPYGPVLTPHPEANSALIMGIVALAGTFVCGILCVLGPFAWAKGAKVPQARSTPIPSGGAGAARPRPAT